MKALKILIFALALILTFSACGKDSSSVAIIGGADGPTSVMVAEKEEESAEKEETAEKTEKKDSVKSDEKAENKSDEKKSEPEKSEGEKFYYVSESEGELNITYHTKDCELTKGKEVMEINSDFVTMIGLKRCEKCNPPELKK